MIEYSELLKSYKEDFEVTSKASYGKVLLVDDDRSINQGLERFLKQKNFEVVISYSGREGLNKLTHDTSVIILDVKLPKEDGTEVYSRLKEKRPEIPIIFYSAYPGEESKARKCFELNPFAFVEKGGAENIDRLFSLIQKATQMATIHPQS